MIKHHPTAETLIDFVTGRLDLGRSVVVAAHAETCAACAAELRLMRGVGGALLSEAGGTPLQADALTRALARIEAVEREFVQRPAEIERDEDRLLPQAVRDFARGKWQWIGPGIHRCMLALPDDSGARVFLLKARPGTKMPDHTHTGVEFTLVLSGAFAHDLGRFGPGDFEEADDSVEHQPIVEAGDVCICLVAMDGTLKLNGTIGRLLQPFVGI